MMAGYYDLLLDDLARQIFETTDAIALAAGMRETHGLCDQHGDVAKRQPAREVDRRGREADLVPIRHERSLLSHSAA
jgi:hypothetical protein